MPSLYIFTTPGPQWECFEILILILIISLKINYNVYGDSVTATAMQFAGMIWSLNFVATNKYYLFTEYFFNFNLIW